MSALERLWAIGVDGMFTNLPDRLRGMLLPVDPPLTPLGERSPATIRLELRIESGKPGVRYWILLTPGARLEVP